jgi:hypothetical protein
MSCRPRVAPQCQGNIVSPWRSSALNRCLSSATFGFNFFSRAGKCQRASVTEFVASLDTYGPMTLKIIVY